MQFSDFSLERLPPGAAEVYIYWRHAIQGLFQGEGPPFHQDTIYLDLIANTLEYYVSKKGNKNFTDIVACRNFGDVDAVPPSCFHVWV